MYKKISLFLVLIIGITFSFSCKGGGGGGPKIKKAPAGYKMFVDKQNGFKFAHPEKWKVTGFADRGSATVSAPGGGFFVKTRKKRKNETLDSVAQGFQARFKMWKDKLDMHEKKDTTLSGYDAKKFVYTMKGYSEKSQYLVFAIAGDTYYELIYDGSAKTFKDIKDKIQTIKDTFHILKK